MRHPPDLQPSERHRPLYPEPASGPNLLVAFLPAGILVVVSLLGVVFGNLVPTHETVTMAETWAPLIAAVLIVLTAVIAMRCRAPLAEEIVSRPLPQLGAIAAAAFFIWISAPAFVSHGLPALLAGAAEREPASHVVEVLATDARCGGYKGVEVRLFGAVVRSDRLGGPSGRRICGLAPSLWEGLRPGDRLVLHGYEGSLAFHYERVTR